jgi:sugar phosphate isomerase/epimerase
MRDFSKDHRWLSINTATVRKQGDFVAIVDACARLGIRAVSPWRDQVAQVGLDKAVKAVRDAGLVLSGYCRGGMFPADKAHLQKARDDNRRAVDEAKALGAPCLVLVAGGLPQHSRPGSAANKDIAAAQAMVEEEIGILLDYAREVKLPLAIEPLHPMYAADRACVNTTRQALDICDRLDPRNSDGMLGLALDVYHIFWDFEALAQIKRAGRKRILAFHVCDWLVPTTDLLLDRGMMGDGEIDIPKLRAAVEAEGFDGYSEVEIFSQNNWWKRPMEEVLKTCIERHKTVV